MLTKRGLGSARRNAIIAVLLIFGLSILIRLPSINRPVSKHYEFNTAVILINIMSWRQAGGGDRLQYTPVMNFQNDGDKRAPNNLYIDKKGNTVYLSYGPGFYLIPYFFYSLFQLPASPLYLQILNILIHLITVLLFFRLLEMLIPSSEPNKYRMIISGCCFLIFAPGLLWFLGNGYINIGAMLPVVLGAFLLILPMFQNPHQIRALPLAVLWLLIVLLIYIDWYVLLFCAVTGGYALIRFRENKKMGWLLMVLTGAVISGIALVFFQFASHMGSVAVIDYWLRRFSDRGLNLAGNSLLTKIHFLAIYFFSSYLPLILLILFLYFRGIIRKIKTGWTNTEKTFLGLFTASLIGYNTVLFEWSSDHEFSILPWGILFSYLGARLLWTYSRSRIIQVVTIFTLISIGQYYWINRPGPVSRDGLRYDAFQIFGDSLRNLPPDFTLCTDLDQNPMIEYYAGRNLFRAADTASARKALDEQGIQKALWIVHDGFRFQKAEIIRQSR